MKTSITINYELNSDSMATLSTAADILVDLASEVTVCGLPQSERDRIQKRIKVIVDDIEKILDDEMI